VGDTILWGPLERANLSHWTTCASITTVLYIYIRSDNKVRELTTMCLLWQQWTETSVWFDDIGISTFHSCDVVVDLWESLSEWCLLVSECALVCYCKNVRTMSSPPPSPENGNRSSFRNVVFFGIQDDEKSPQKFCEFCIKFLVKLGKHGSEIRQT
jgi:hypothetical protein